MTPLRFALHSSRSTLLSLAFPFWLCLLQPGISPFHFTSPSFLPLWLLFLHFLVYFHLFPHPKRRGLRLVCGFNSPVSCKSPIHNITRSQVFLFREFSLYQRSNFRNSTCFGIVLPFVYANFPFRIVFPFSFPTNRHILVRCTPRMRCCCLLIRCVCGY